MSEQVHPECLEDGLTVRDETHEADFGLRELEAQFAHVLQTTHPVRLGAALRRAEAEAESSWPEDQVASVLERVIRQTLDHSDAPYGQAPLR
ncbi:hypothetical protein V6U77_26505 [Micromonospora sp. CPCC 205546]|uniref:hypothetical protein n=1 Tax=Micromonospora sp. CPCC 205546 TaxID=3122397 RepID=UPI002FF06490